MMQLSLEGDGISSDFGGELRSQEALNEDSNSSVGLGLIILAVIALAVVLVQRYARHRANTASRNKY